MTALPLHALRPLPARTRRDEVRALPRVLASEWLKLTSLRSNRAAFALTVLFGGGIAWAVATFAAGEAPVVAEVYVYSTVLTAVFAAVAGILLFTGEAQHGTLPGVLTAQPARWVVAAAKAVTAAAVGLALGAAGMAAGAAGAAAGGLELGDTSGMAARTGWSLLFTVTATLLGLGIGMIARHGAGAISGLLVWWLVAENLLNLFLPVGVQRFLPFFAGTSMLGIEWDGADPAALAVALSAGQNALVFGGYAAVALLAGTVLLYRRDTT